MNYLRFVLILLTLSAGMSSRSQGVQKGPYTVHEISENVYRIEDANETNPPGGVVGDEGQLVSMNNCSDMYLIIGGNKGLLIDLSNDVKWDPTARESLHSLVHEIAGDKELCITVTHRHGDHLGMLPAFLEDPKARFWIPGNEFSGMDIFPEARTTYFQEYGFLDLGGEYLVNTLEVPGHTAHSTVFILAGTDLVFTGDAIGSGSGVWLFNEASFYTYRGSIESLIAYMEDDANQVDTDELRIFGGHFWQGEEPDGLRAQYIYDMRTLMGEMEKGSVKPEDMSTFISFLDANFTYGTATITWNKEAAAKFAASSKDEQK